jgi:hypothetical protein
MATFNGTVTFTASELHAIAQQVATLLTPAQPPVTPPVVTPPVITPPLPTGQIPHLDYIIYQNGSGALLQDDSWAMRSVDYADTIGRPMGGTADLAATIDGPNGGWQPLFVPNGATSFLDLTPYQYLLMSIKPTTDGANYWVGFAGNKDTADGNQIQVAGPGMTAYGPAPVKGQWANYKIPLSAFKLADAKAVFKVGIACGNFPGGTTSYFDSVGFAKN